MLDVARGALADSLTCLLTHCGTCAAATMPVPASTSRTPSWFASMLLLIRLLSSTRLGTESVFIGLDSQTCVPSGCCCSQEVPLPSL